jgi:hypothetical protein
VHRYLLPGIQEAYGDMEGDPGQREPARPVVTAEHEHAADNRNGPHERNPNEFERKGVRRLEVGCVEGEAGYTRCDQYATQNGDGDWTPGHDSEFVIDPLHAIRGSFQSATYGRTGPQQRLAAYAG